MKQIRLSQTLTLEASLAGVWRLVSDRCGELPLSLNSDDINAIIAATRGDMLASMHEHLESVDQQSAVVLAELLENLEARYVEK